MGFRQVVLKYKRPILETTGVFLLLSVFLTVCLSAVFYSSPTADEPAHITAGYGYLVYGDARLNIEHPPLLKAVSATITSRMNNIVFPSDKFLAIKSNFWGVQWQAGSDYIYAPGNSPTALLFFSRLPMALLAVTLGIVVYLWGRKLYGLRGGFLALIFYCFSPSILGHAPLITTDIGVSFGFIITLFSYTSFLQKEGNKKCYWGLLTVLSLAFLFLAKFSAILVLPVLFLMPWLSVFLYDKKASLRKKFRGALEQVLLLGALISLSLIVTYVAYAFFMRGMPSDIYEKEVAEVFTNDKFGLKGAIISIPIVFRPIGYYITGFVYVAKHSSNGHLSYFLGNLSMKGVWYYFPVVYFLKTQLIWWLALFIALLLAIKKRKLALDELAIVIFAAVYLAFSMNSSLNIGIRHIFPVIVLLFIFSAKSVELFGDNTKFKYAFMSFVIFLYVLPTFLAYPFYLSYTNSLVSETSRYRYFGDSSLDWGQDLYRLKKYVEARGIDNLKVDYFGGNIPVGYYLPNAEYWDGKMGVPGPGYIAISSTHLQFAPRYGKAGREYYDFFIKLTPVDQLGGGSILLFKL